MLEQEKQCANDWNIYFFKTEKIHALSAAFCATSARGLSGAQTANFAVCHNADHLSKVIPADGWRLGGGELNLPVSNSLKAAQEISPERRSAAATVQESIVRVEKSLR